MLSAVATAKLLPVIGAYQYLLAAAVRRLYRCHLCEDKRKIMRGTGGAEARLSGENARGERPFPEPGIWKLLSARDRFAPPAPTRHLAATFHPAAPFIG